MVIRSADHPITRSPNSSCYTSPFPLMLKAAAPGSPTRTGSLFRAWRGGGPGSPTRAGSLFRAWRGGSQRCATLIAAVLLVLPCLAQQEPPSPWQAAADDFVQQILARSGSLSAINISFANLSSLSSADQSAIRQIVMTDFRNSGVRLVKTDFAVAEVEITFSENWQSYVWMAEIKQSSGNQIVIRSVPRPQKINGTRGPVMSIKKTLIWQQDTAILDFYSDGENLMVLEPGQVSLYGNDAGKWRLKQTLGISHERPWPRDLRGRLQVTGFQISTFLPGTFCTGTTTPPAIQCRTSDDPWQIDQGTLAAFFSPTRNFFTGVLAGRSAGESVPAFFSAAATQNGTSRMAVFAGTDGRARIFQNNLSAAGIVVNDWGSNLTAVNTSCGNGWQILATTPGDLNHSDSVQAFEIEGHQQSPVSQPVDLEGPVLALWPGENPQTAHAVIQSLATGKYEAWTLVVTCNQ